MEKKKTKESTLLMKIKLHGFFVFVTIYKLIIHFFFAPQQTRQLNRHNLKSTTDQQFYIPCISINNSYITFRRKKNAHNLITNIYFFSHFVKKET